MISRQVEPGQTVAASLKTPTLFTIAQDLSQMQVDVAIDESDIGRIRADQRATFTVDAFPGRTFEGTRRADPQGRADGAERRHLHGRRRDAEPGPEAVPRHDRERAHRRRQREQRAEGAERGAALAPVRREPAAPTARRRRAAAGGGGGGGDAQARRQRLVDELKLDAAQAARVDEIFAEQRNRMAELRDLNDADRRQRGERMRAEVRQKINAMLTAEQQKRYAEIVASETGRATAPARAASTCSSTAARRRSRCAPASPTAPRPRSSAATSRKATR